MDQARHSVVYLTAQICPLSYSEPWRKSDSLTSVGTGTVLSNRRILTCEHVVHDSVEITVHLKGEQYRAAYIRGSVHYDCALLTVSDDTFWKHVESLDMQEGWPEQGESVVCYGFPATSDSVSTTSGTVSRIVTMNGVLVQVSASINSGNSGGPGLNKSGKIIGMVSRKFPREAEGMAFMIPVVSLQMFLERGRERFMGLGAGVQQTHSDALRKRHKIESLHGVLVTYVLPQSKAVGFLERGDLITEVCGFAVARDGTIALEEKRDTERLHFSVLSIIAPLEHDTLPMVIRRGGREMHVRVPLTDADATDDVPVACRARCFTVGGLVIVPDTRGWRSDSRTHSCGSELFRVRKNVPERLVISHVLSHPVNQSWEKYGQTGLLSVNGTALRDLDALAQHVNAQIRGGAEFLEFGTDSSGMIVLECARLAEAEKELHARYGMKSVL